MPKVILPHNGLQQDQVSRRPTLRPRIRQRHARPHRYPPPSSLLLRKAAATVAGKAVMNPPTIFHERRLICGKCVPASPCHILGSQTCACESLGVIEDLDDCEQSRCSATDFAITTYSAYELCTPDGFENMSVANDQAIASQMAPGATGTASLVTSTGGKAKAKELCWYVALGAVKSP